MEEKGEEGGGVGGSRGEVKKRYVVNGSRCPSINIFLVKGGEAGAAAPKGSMSYAFTYGEFSSPSVRPSIWA